MDTVQKELLELTRAKPKKGESAEDFTRRVLQKANSLCDDRDKWEGLSEAAQAWINNNIMADEADPPKPLKLLELDEPEEGGTEAQEEAEAEDEEEEKVVKKVAKKSDNGKGKVVKLKPTKKAAAGRGRKPLGPSDEKKIKIVSKPPGRAGTIRQKMFSKYKDGMTVAEARKAGVPYNYMRWHAEEGWIRLS